MKALSHTVSEELHSQDLAMYIIVKVPQLLQQ